jgi:hypothetical protein
MHPYGNAETPPGHDNPPPLSLPSAEDTKGSDDGRLTWSTAMVEALVVYIYGAFKNGRLSDNGLQKELWTEAAIEVNRACYGKKVPWDKIKNKWGSDIKEKWKYWVLLSEMSGFGWNEETEKFEAYDYFWDLDSASTTPSSRLSPFSQIKAKAPYNRSKKVQRLISLMRRRRRGQHLKGPRLRKRRLCRERNFRVIGRSKAYKRDESKL